MAIEKKETQKSMGTKYILKINKLSFKNMQIY